MGKNSSSWLNKQKQDPYYKKAKKLGFRARSAFKLQQIDRKYQIFKVNGRIPMRILDLGAAPGSWIEVILRQSKKGPNGKVPKKMKIIGIDLTTVQPFENTTNVETFRADLFKPKCDEIIQQFAPYDLILSDLAPKTSGDFRDIAIQEAMVEKVVQLTENSLKPGGHVVVKIFQSEETQNFVKTLKSRFELVKLIKPKASRPSSRELYMVAHRFHK